MAANEVIPFRIETGEVELGDLRERLRRTRWPDPETVEDWSQGVPAGYLRDLCGYWAESYDWRRVEACLNALPQFERRSTASGSTSSTSARPTPRRCP